MEQKTLMVNNHINLGKGITPQEGQPIFAEIDRFLNEGYKVVLDFGGIDLMTTAFLNVVIGNLYKDHTSEQLKERLDFKNCNISTTERIKRVIETAKQFYKDKDGLEQTFDDVVYGTI